MLIIRNEYWLIVMLKIEMPLWVLARLHPYYVTLASESNPPRMVFVRKHSSHTACSEITFIQREILEFSYLC